MSAIVLDGWTLRVDAGEPLVRDVDLGERAGLRMPRDVRRTIKAAIDDGALTEATGGVGAAHTPIAWTEDEVVSGNKAKVYYLNEEGALLILTRLRTKTAVAVTRALVSVFVKVRRGELPAVSAEPAHDALGAYDRAAAMLTEAVDAELLDKREAVLRKMVLFRKETGIDLLAAPTEAPARGLPQAADLAEGERLIVTRPVDKAGHYSATELGRPYGLSAVVVGKLADAAGIKGSGGYGKWSPITDGQGRVINQQFLYNDAGRLQMQPMLVAEADRRQDEAKAKAARRTQRAAAQLATGTALGGKSGGAS